MFDKPIVIVTPWFDGFVGGAGSLAKGMAGELNRRGVRTIVFTTCSLSPYDSWWDNHYVPGVYEIEGIETRRFPTGEGRLRYQNIIRKMQQGSALTAEDEEDFFKYGINSGELLDALEEFVDRDSEILALPYFHLTYSVINKFPGKISLIPCFHNESQFYWRTTEHLLRDAKRIFYNSPEEKEMTIRQYGRVLGRKIVEGTMAGVGVELPAANHDPVPSEPVLPVNYFVYAGRKEIGKNVPQLCEWFAEYARQSDTTTKLVFIGGGDQHLLPRSDYFLDLGFVPEATKRHVIRGSQGLISLSRNESFSIVIMEAWLLGVPVIVSADCAVTKAHVRRCDGGLYVESSEEFSATLNYLEQHEPVRTQLAANGRKYVSQNFSFDVVLARYLQTFSDKEPALNHVSAY